MNYFNLEMLSELLDKLPIAVFVLQLEDKENSEFRIILANKTNDEATGVSWTPFIGQIFRDVFPVAYETPLVDYYMKVIETGSKIELGEIEYGDSKISRQTFFITANPLGSDKVIVSYENISALKKVNSELNRKNKELEQFTYVASHDLQEPLRTISTSVDFLEKTLEKEATGQVGMVLQFLKSSSERMSALVSGLLVHSRIGKDKELQKVDCQKVVDALIEDVSSLIEKKKATIIIGRLPTILAYKTDIRLLFQNLIVNAINFGKPGSRAIVEIGEEENEKSWTFFVKDNGIGIQPEFKEKIFYIFQRLHSKKEYEGTGIGLAHCKKIIEMHDGQIWVESELGNGSTFYFSIPK